MLLVADNRLPQAAAEDFEEAENELMLADEEQVPYFVGECFFHLDKEQAEERLQQATEKGAAQVEALQKERAHIQASRDELKTVLYGRFGSNINLEE
ncbi:hypothetical protein QBZ16_001369 [Prototheca wickerhamii]|uniref:Prefoldin subunit 4 n=1 Tax=Prototheca wickerhamii TaxID=3111 RepID=A0AAD9IEJ8_PROWI|nr:hypothetical protein QBZ16_001369 [Prototheca wickerhamii]